MLKGTLLCRASSPTGAYRNMSSETKPIRFVPEMLRVFHAPWWDGTTGVFREKRRLENWEKRWPVSEHNSRSPYEWHPILRKTYSKEALAEATKMVPEWFETSDVPRPPQRIAAHSEGIVGRWYTNYWTLHSVKYQCMLANVPWTNGERRPIVSNFEEPKYYVDFEESRAIRDYRSRWINVHRSMIGMTKRLKEVVEEDRFKVHKRHTDAFWSDRRVFLNRVRAMRVSGEEFDKAELPIPSLNFKAFDM
jgi:hypothetical protein